jgi:hypothetical protein
VTDLRTNVDLKGLEIDFQMSSAVEDPAHVASVDDVATRFARFLSFFRTCTDASHAHAFSCARLMIKNTTHSFAEDAYAYVLVTRKLIRTPYGRGFFTRKYSDDAARHVASLSGFEPSKDAIEFCMALRVSFVFS